MSLDVYGEGERLAEMAVREGVGRKQLKTIVNLCKTRGKKGIDSWIKRQISRGLFSYEFGIHLKGLLERAERIEDFQRTVGVAHEMTSWFQVKPVMEVLYKNRQAILRELREYCGYRGYGKADLRIYADKSGGVQLKVYMERPPRDRGAAARDAMVRLTSRLPELRRLKFKIWIDELVV